MDLNQRYMDLKSNSVYFMENSIDIFLLLIVISIGFQRVLTPMLLLLTLIIVVFGLRYIQKQSKLIISFVFTTLMLAIILDYLFEGWLIENIYLLVSLSLLLNLWNIDRNQYIQQSSKFNSIRQIHILYIIFLGILFSFRLSTLLYFQNPLILGIFCVASAYSLNRFWLD